MKNLRMLCSQIVCRCVGAVLDATRGRFPAVVRIETTNACNARCVICPHKDMNRPIRQMDDALFDRILDECAAQRCREIHLHNFGEPLLDKRLEDRIRRAKEKGIAKVKIFSNGSLLTAERARGLIDAGLDEIKISFDGATREEFEAIRRPLKFDRVVGNVEQLVKLRNELGSKLKIHVACCSTTDREATMQALSRIVDGFAFGKIHNWASEGEPVGRTAIRKPCDRLWRTFTILAGGEVALCCLDYDGQHLLGRLDAGTTIREIFDSQPYREVRRRHRQARQSEIDLCATCSKAFL